VSCSPLEETDRNRCREALIRAGLWEKIASLPQKEETYLGKDMADDGITLSGGEMQKLMMARALYKNCHLLLLDEPTAALDAISENKMYETYSTLLKNKTALFISHRLASTRFCDTILFLENGKIKECGTHDELIALGGSYAHMFEVQSQYYQETEEDI
jgi:ATP-binding cassette subfamily B protein